MTKGKQRALSLKGKQRALSLKGKQRALSLKGKQRALSLDIWPVPTIGSVIGFSCVYTTVVSTLVINKYSEL